MPGIPALHQLSKKPRWLGWRAIRGRKLPFNGRDKKSIDIRDHKKLICFETALCRYKASGFSGLGFVLDGHRDRIAGVDLDNGIADDGNPRSWALDIIKEFNSYTEISPSGRGYKILFLADLMPRPRRHVLTIAHDAWKNQQIETWTENRFFAITGRHLDIVPDQIEDATEAYERLLWRMDQEESQGAAGLRPSYNFNPGTTGADIDPDDDRPLSHSNLRTLRKYKFLASLWAYGAAACHYGDRSRSGLDMTLANAGWLSA